ncbi:MAG TPA: alpha/beta fold hydrolase [Candidatus Paceibacterota bacterium]|nr:alpha/beta fold hydrolase [Candidatus Paceibacterota bacterium]
MKNALLLHGTGNTPSHNWLPWLKAQLEQRGYKVWVPQLPEAEFPNMDRYVEFVSSAGWDFNNDSILVGHSSGAVAILGILQHLPDGVKARQAILVGSFKDDLGREDLKGLFEKPIVYEKVKTKAQEFILLHSDDDPYCPLEHAEFLAEQLEGELVLLPGEKHFSISTGGERFKELPEILKYLQE